MGLLLATVFGIGPAFFTLIQTSINKGFRRAVFLDIGIILNDIMIVTVMLMSSIQINLGEGKSSIFAGFAAGVVLILYGIYTFKVPPDKIVKISESESEKLEQVKVKKDKFLGLAYIAKGFVMNLFNPFVWVFWMGCVATAVGLSGDTADTAMFFLGVFSTVFGLDILKAWGAALLHKFFTENMLKIVNKATGIILGGFGAFLFVYSLVQLLP